MKNTPHPNPHPAAYSVVPQGAREQEVSHFDLAAFVAQFPLFARAPNGIANLRALILQLAVQGKLVPQDPTDEPASVLISHFDEIKPSRNHKNKKPLVNNKLKLNIPKSWVLVSLQDAFDVRDGTHDSPKYIEKGYPLITSKNLFTGSLSFNDVKYISEEDHLKISARSKVQKNDILFAMIGSIGNPVIVDTEMEFSIKNVALFKYYNSDKSCPKYLLYYLRVAAEWMKEESSGGVQSFVSLGKLRETPFPLPPLEEQQRIVEKVDELMALCDQLEAQQDDQARNLLEANTAAVQAVTKTPIPSPSPARGEGSEDAQENDDLLSPHPLAGGGLGRGGNAWQRIATHFNTLYGTNLPLPSDMRRGKLKDRTVALENVAKLRELILEVLTSSRGNLVKIKELGKVLSGMTPSKQNQNYWDGSVCWVSPKDMKTSVIHDSIDHITELALAENNIKTIPENSILFVVRGMILAHSFPAATNSVAVTINQDMKALLLDKSVSVEYITLVFQGMKNRVMDLVERSTHGTCKLPIDKFLAQKIPLPPLAEQHRIVAQVDELMALCDTLETLLTEQRQVAADFSAAAVQAMGA